VKSPKLLYSLGGLTSRTRLLKKFENDYSIFAITLSMLF
jgi:hypothetical protein